MRLLIITQKVDINDDNLGFFHHWLEKLAGLADELRVACLSEGKHELPDNVSVFTLGKERGYSKLRQLFRLQKFLLSNLPEVDGVFIHMCPIYAIASFPLTKIFGKKFVMFYAHGAVHPKLRMAEKAVDAILTSSSTGCRLKSKKVKVIGQGIDTELFRPIKEVRPPEEVEPRAFRILFAGRINKTKDQETLIRAVDILVNKRNIKNITARIAGHPLVKSEKEYLNSLKEQVLKNGLGEHVEFVDGLPYSKMPQFYCQTDLFVNPSSTGSLDKVVLEAMASGCLVLTCNEAYREILSSRYLFEKKNPEDLAEKIFNLMKTPKDPSLREAVVKNHNLDNFIDKIISEFK